MLEFNNTRSGYKNKLTAARRTAGLWCCDEEISADNTTRERDLDSRS